MRSLSLLALILIIGVIGAFILYNLAPPKTKVLRVATTTSLYATGLLETLAKEFSERNPSVIIQFIAVGSGEALKRASRGDADMVFVHAPALERKYVEGGVLVNHNIFAYNYFVIVGPPEDPAGIKNLDPVEAFRKIYEEGRKGAAIFVSRGDNSGTHQRELSIWKRIGLNPSGEPWYLEAGTGMSKTLLIANERGAYTLTDIGTYLKLRAEERLPDLEVLVQGGDILANVYSVYLVNPEKVPGINYELAKKFADFVTSEEGQSIIAKYGIEGVGSPLFSPAMGSKGLGDLWKKLAEG